MGRSPCCEKAHTNKGAWTKEEDQRLINHIRANGEGCWRSLPKAADPQTHRPLNTITTVKSYSDARNSSSPSLLVPEIVNNMSDDAHIKIDSDSAEEGNSSGTTEEQLQQQPELNLDLCISLPFQGQPPCANTAESKQISFEVFAAPPPVVTQAVCLCCQLGFKSSQACDCQTVTAMIPASALHRYYRPLDS
ncbi:hypothetical protein HHK36_030329 [Tetracentron sinense]|uniref:Uncharacterized protein n=1 Tax=Tetracentron sinense TaxID=13715 RepID=A0A834Y728_TETSI|nr:hypothetical protein HHK36_032891 [Tetracentron sinense]KAF8376958.1 hypothetical protein HHK36_030329 [Tetracentron sinense]